MLLSGVRVLDLGSFITAPLAAMMLGDFGADVIKVERPEGDPFRRAGGTHYGATFLAFNRNKRSVVLDFSQKEDREALFKLVESADVLIDNYRSAALVKLGLAPDVIMARNARLIHCSITGFGAEGPYAERPAFDSVGQALSGIASMLIDPKDPRAFGPTISDNVTGMYAAYAVLGRFMSVRGPAWGAGSKSTCLSPRWRSSRTCTPITRARALRVIASSASCGRSASPSPAQIAPS